MAIVTNDISYNYTVNGVKKSVSSQCSVEIPNKEPSVSIVKTGWYHNGVVNYRADIVIGDGDEFETVQNIQDTIDGATFIEGTLKVDGELSEIQNIKYLELDFKPNTAHYIEYQCQR